jgi:hypothetical protein
LAVVGRSSPPFGGENKELDRPVFYCVDSETVFSEGRSKDLFNFKRK